MSVDVQYLRKLEAKTFGPGTNITTARTEAANVANANRIAVKEKAITKLEKVHKSVPITLECKSHRALAT